MGINYTEDGCGGREDCEPCEEKDLIMVAARIEANTKRIEDAVSRLNELEGRLHGECCANDKAGGEIGRAGMVGDLLRALDQQANRVGQLESVSRDLARLA